MVESGKVRADRFVLIAGGVRARYDGAHARRGRAGRRRRCRGDLRCCCGLAVRVHGGPEPLIEPMRRLVVGSARAVAVVYGLFDCGLRYLALDHAPELDRRGRRRGSAVLVGADGGGRRRAGGGDALGLSRRTGRPASPDVSRRAARSAPAVR